MPVADFLEKVGKGVERGAKVAGAVALPVAERTAQVVSGEAPQIDEEKRQQQYKLEDAQIAAKEQELTQQLEMGRKYGSLTPEQQGQYVDAMTKLYSNPRHAGTLMEKLRKAVHPNGAVATPGLSTLKNATPEGGTVAADDTAEIAGEQKKLAAQIDYFKKNMMPMFPPEQQAQKLNEYIDHLNGLKDPTDKPPKGFKPIEQGGIAAGLTDQDTGKQYTRADLGPTGTAPPEAKQFWKGITDAEADKKADEEKKAEESEKRQERAFNHAFAMQESAIRNAISKGDYDTAKKEVGKADEAYQASLDRASTMDKAAVAAKQGDQQAMFAVLANHIAMTLQQPQVSARPTKAMFDEAAGSLPWMSKIGARFDQDGYLSGIVLTPDQIDKMTDLGHQKVDTQKDHVDRVKQEFADDLNPTDGQGKPIKKPGGVARALSPVSKPGGAWKVPADAPPAPKEDNKVLKANGQIVAKSKGGQWVQP